MIAVVLLILKTVFFVGVGVSDVKEQRVEKIETKLEKCYISQVLEGWFSNLSLHTRILPVTYFCFKIGQLRSQNSVKNTKNINFSSIF